MIAVTVQKPRAIFSLVLLSAWLASLPTEADAFDSQGLEDVTISFDFWGIEDVTFTDGPGCETTAPDYARAPPLRRFFVSLEFPAISTPEHIFLTTASL